MTTYAMLQDKMDVRRKEGYSQHPTLMHAKVRRSVQGDNEFPRYIRTLARWHDGT